MRKIAVGQTIGAAYRFAFGDMGRLFGIAWFPLFLAMIGTLFNAALAFQMASQVTGANPNYPFAASGLSRLNAITMLVSIAMFVLRTMLIFGLTEEALTPSPQRRWFYFSLNGRVWTLVLGYFLFVLIVIGIFIGIALIFGLSAIIAGMAAAAQGRPTAHSVVLIIGGAVGGSLIVFLLFLYLILRWSFLMAPVAVAEGDIGLSRSWKLMRGNVGRSFAACLAIFLPLMIVGGAIAFLCFGELVIGPIRDLIHAGTAGMSEAQIDSLMKAWGARIGERAFTLLPVILGLGFLFGAFFNGLFAGATANAYRVLVANSPPPAPL